LGRGNWASEGGGLAAARSKWSRKQRKCSFLILQTTNDTNLHKTLNSKGLFVFLDALSG